MLQSGEGDPGYRCAHPGYGDFGTYWPKVNEKPLGG